MDNFLDKSDLNKKISEEQATRKKDLEHDIAEAMREFMSTERGRMATWHLCALDSVFAGPYSNDAMTTQYICGQQIAALGMRSFIRSCVGLELYQTMERENDKSQESNDARRNPSN